jgi:small subunit ribosomal protein S16
MTTRIRLRRMGSNKRPFFRVVVADQRSPRDGRFIENIGKYHPLDDPSVIEIDQDRALHWLRVGAQPSNQVRNLMNKIGIWDEFVKERPSAAAGPAKERTSKPKLSKKAKQKAEAAASEPEQAAVQETPHVELEPEVAEPEVAEPEVAEADAAEAVEAVNDASAEKSPEEEAATEEAAPAEEAPTSEADEPTASAEPSGTDDA